RRLANARRWIGRARDQQRAMALDQQPEQRRCARIEAASGDQLRDGEWAIRFVVPRAALVGAAGIEHNTPRSLSWLRRHACAERLACATPRAQMMGDGSGFECTAIFGLHDDARRRAGLWL